MSKQLRVGIVGGGLGGLSAAIATARAGADVTVLEAATELGEIGAGIHIFPNASRFLVRWGVDKLIGSNLVEHDWACTWSGGPELNLISRLDAKEQARKCGFPWYIVRRDHLHAGLAESAREHGAKIVVNARITSYDDTSHPSEVIVHTTPNYSPTDITNGVHLQQPTTHKFDILIAADGIKSAIRTQLFPEVQPIPYAPAVAYRHTLKVDTLLAAVPEAKGWFSSQFNMWCGPHGYLVTYPLSGGAEVNITVCFYTDQCDRSDPTTWPDRIVENADLSEIQQQLKAYPTVIQKMWALVPGSNRWPMLHIPVHKVPRWLNESGNVVLLGDACHAMNPALAQGAATAIEDAAFLGHVIGDVQRGVLGIKDATRLYEQRRRPKAWMKQMNAFVAADLEMGGPGPTWLVKGQDQHELGKSKFDYDYELVQRARDFAGTNSNRPKSNTSNPEHPSSPSQQSHMNSTDDTQSPIRAAYSAGTHNIAPSPSQSQTPVNNWAHPAFNVASTPRHFYYDAEADADDAVCQFLLEQGKVVDERRGTVGTLERKFWACVAFGEGDGQ